jgi:hypothetical protein
MYSKAVPWAPMALESTYFPNNEQEASLPVAPGACQSDLGRAGNRR